ncbi:MAG: DUF4168 domain-containing protein [Nitrospirales bacterium]
MNVIPMSLKSLRVLVVIASIMGLAPLAVPNAQALESQPPPKELIGPNLEPFVGAYKEISQIHSAYTERITQSGDPSRTDTLQQEANEKMNQAVSKYGLTIEDYNTIFNAILNDPALKEEFLIVLNRKS